MNQWLKEIYSLILFFIIYIMITTIMVSAFVLVGFNNPTISMSICIETLISFLWYFWYKKD